MKLSYYEFFYFLFMILITVYIWLGARNIYNKEYHFFKIRNLHYDEIDTGDIILLSYSSPTVAFSQGITCMKFIHSALFSKEGSNLYIFEFSNYFNQKVGFLKIPFSEWIKYNKNALMMMNKLRIDDDSREKRDNLSLKINNFRDNNMTNKEFNFFEYLVRYLLPGTEYKDFDATRTDYSCYELILNILKEVDIIQSLNATESYVTDDLIGMKKFNLNKEYSYDEYFLADISSLKFISD